MVSSSSTIIILSFFLAVMTYTCLALVLIWWQARRENRKVHVRPGVLFLRPDNVNKQQDMFLHLQYLMEQSVFAPNIVDAFVIHMSSRMDRLVHINALEACLKSFVRLKVVEASNAIALPDGVTQTKCRGRLRGGEIGCLLSHLKILQEISGNAHYTSMENNWVLIFEDDVTLQVPTNKIQKRMKQALQVMPPTTAIVYFGFGGVFTAGIVPVGKYSYVGRPMHGTHAYAIRCVHAYKVAKLCVDSGACEPIDTVFQRIKNAGLVYAKRDRHTTVEGSIWGHGVFGQDLQSVSNIQNQEHVTSLSRMTSAQYM